MSKSRFRRGSRKSIYLILGFSFILALGYVYFRALLSPAPAQIFPITPTVLEYGNTTVEGTLRKDAPAGSPGNFILVLSDSRPILLDVQGLDHLLNQTVTVSGLLSPAAETSAPMTMVVSQLTVAQ
ncbi:MAG: hypothetical protein ABII21_00450 [bacterium]